MRALASLVLAALALAAPARASPRVFSLDQCADQFVLALAPRSDIVGLSMRADDPDSHLRADAGGLPLRRATLESALAARPDLVVRYWGGEPGLVRRLQARGVRVVTLEDAADFDGVRRNVRAVAAALGRPDRGEALVSRMDGQLAAGQGAWGGRGALYLTSGGFTTGPGGLIDAILRAAGMSNLVRRPGYAAVPLEQLVLHPPAAFVLGFFDRAGLAGQSRSLAERPVLRRVMAGRPATSLPSDLLGCPAWFAGDAVQRLAAAAHP